MARARAARAAVAAVVAESRYLAEDAAELLAGDERLAGSAAREELLGEPVQACAAQDDGQVKRKVPRLRGVPL